MAVSFGLKADMPVLFKFCMMEALVDWYVNPVLS